MSVCRDVGGIQCQVITAAEMALWARMHDLEREDIDAALWTRRALVKTSALRGTLHLIPTRDFTAYIAALKRSRAAVLEGVMAKFGVTQKDIDRMHGIVMDALLAGPMTQQELARQVARAAGKRIRAWMERVWSPFRLSLVEGLICYGPERGREVTFVRVDRWLPEQSVVDEPEAKRWLLRRYLRAYGPATPEDFSKWTGLTMREVRSAHDDIKRELTEVYVDDTVRFILREDVGRLTERSALDGVVRLLPSFDPYMLGHADKHHLVNAHNYKRVYRKQGWIAPVILSGGEVIGTWAHRRRGKRLSLRVRAFNALSKKIRGSIDGEAASLGRFLNTSYDITFD